MGKQSPDDLLTVDEASELSGVPPTTLRENARKGRLPARKMGRDWVFRRADVMAFEHRGPGRPWPKKEPAKKAGKKSRSKS